MISGNPVRSEIERTGRPASARAVAVPPVEMISTPSSFKPRANSTMPVLLDTDSNARATRTSGTRATRTSPRAISVWVSRSVPDSIAPTLPLDHDAARILLVDPKRPRSDQPDRLWQQLVLDRLQPFPHLLHAPGVRQIHGSLQDHRPGVDPFIHEVDRDAEDLDAVIERLLDRAQPGKGRKQRGLDIDHAPPDGAQ